MAPFTTPKHIISGFKERIEALTVQGDRLYVGTATGNLHIYGIDTSSSSGEDTEIVSLIETKKNLTRRSIDRLGFIKDINSLILLSEELVTLYPLPTLSPPTPLSKAKGAFSFAVYTSVQHLSPDGRIEQPSDVEFGTTKAIPTIVTRLVVGCRRKVVIYTWKDGEAQEVKEAPLPHSPRSISFLDPDIVCFAYPPADYIIFSLITLTTTEVLTPLPATSSVTGTFGGLTGYMTLGLGAKPKPAVVSLSGPEALIVKDNEGFVIGINGKVSRKPTIEWPAPPEEIAFVRPYIFSVLPAGSVATNQGSPSTNTSALPAVIPTTVLQIRSSISLLPTQTIPFPFDSTTHSTTTTAAHTINSTVRLLTSTPTAKSPLFLVTTPMDRSTATAEGSCIWQFTMKSWEEQLDELVQTGQYADALALLETIDQAMLPDKEERRTRIRALNAVSQFRDSKFDEAIDEFIELDLNPAKVVALYPETIAGPLSVPREGWISLYGGPENTTNDASSTTSGDQTKEGGAGVDRSAADLLENLAPAGSSIRGKLKTGLGAFMPSSTTKEDDTVSISSKRKIAELPDDLHRSVESLLKYLSDRRPKIAGALEPMHITPASQSHKITSLSESSPEDLLALPNAPLSSLTSEQLLRFAQIVDTALFKSYLIVRPSLLASLCRVANWCEVSQVEEELRSREKFTELIFLYNGKKMHKKALDLLQELSGKETDMEDKLAPSISYLQKLGPEYLDQIFESSRWVFHQDPDKAFEIFTSEDVELPRQAVADYLEEIDPKICARYIEYLIDDRDEQNHSFHDRLAELYLTMTLSAKKAGDEKSRIDFYAKLIQFIDSTQYYRVDRLYGLLSSEDLFEARAILLGRLGRHDQALELYVYRLQNFKKAEEYCKRIYLPDAPTSNVFLTLLRIYLRPTVETTADLLQPALDLISRHSPRLDSIETLQLLPPLVTTQDIQTFLLEALRAPIFDTQVVRRINEARKDQLSRRLMVLQSKRVKVTDSRICPQCHKRLGGNSVIAVHAPRGEVTHYQCREAFSRRLAETRH